jgi:hypothetical protein
MFRNRGCGNWMPGPRVTNFITFSKKINADSSLLCKLNCAGISLNDIRKAAASGTVDFGKSNAQKEPDHEYDITMTVKGKQLEFYISENMNDSTARILIVSPPLADTCHCK